MKGKIFLVLCLIAMISAGCVTVQQFDGSYSYKAGKIMVHTLIDAEREGNAGILVGADADILERLIPETGFSHSTNVFLVKTPTQNILIDTGFGNTIEKMQQFGVAPEQIDAVLITHLHGDHIGGLQKDGAAIFPNAKIYISEKELEFFTQTQVNQGAVTALAPYTTADNVVAFNPAELGSTLNEILPGIKPIANYGHTPGHTAFLVEDGRNKLIIAGDFLHIALVQFANPEISATYDMDREAAAVSRRQILEYAAANKIPVGGMHIVNPGIGNVEKDGDGFKFVPVN